MQNLNRPAMMLPLLLALLTGCASNQSDSQVALQAAIPALPPSARQEKEPLPNSQTYLQRWNLKAEEWRRRLQDHGLAD